MAGAVDDGHGGSGARRGATVLLVAVALAGLVVAVVAPRVPTWSSAAGAPDGEVVLPDARGGTPGASAGPDAGVPGVDCLADETCLRWHVEVGSGSAGAGERVRRADERTLVVLGDGLVAVDADGTRLWRRDLADAATTAVADGLVVVREDDTLRVLDARTGRSRWEARGRPDEQGTRLQQAARLGDVLVVTETWHDSGWVRTGLRAHDLGDGRLRWEREEDHAQLGAGVAVAVNLEGDRIEGVDPTTGTTRWRARPGWAAGSAAARGGMESASVTFLGGHVAVAHQIGGSADVELRLLSAASGQQRLRARSSPVLWGTPQALLVLVGEGRERLLRSVDVDGEVEVRWERRLAGVAGCCSRARAHGDQLLLDGPASDRIRLLDLDSGRTRHATRLPSPDTQAYPAGGDTILLLAPAFGSTTALDVATDRRLWRVETSRVLTHLADDLAFAIVDGTLLALELAG